MPEIGEIRKGRDIWPKRKYLRGNGVKYLWQACESCGKERWVQFLHGEPRAKRCHPCTLKERNGKGSQNPQWKGGRLRSSQGYIEVWLSPNDFFYPMCMRITTGGGYVLEHRLIVAKRLGRCLQPWEIVHHKDHIRDHNTEDNLELKSDIGHRQLTILERKIDKLLEKQEKLETEIRLLRWELKQKEVNHV